MAIAAGREIFIDPLRSVQRRAALPAKLRSTSPIMLHFGCGEIADPRFINVDARVFLHVDYVTKAPTMPAIPKGTADMIYACHVFEHIPFRSQEAVLRRWRELLKSGGELRLSVPDFEKVTDLYRSGKVDFDWMQMVLMGGQEYPGNFHFALFTADRLQFLIERAGFNRVRHWRPAEQDSWPRDWSWEEDLSLNLCANK